MFFVSFCKGIIIWNLVLIVCGIGIILFSIVVELSVVMVVDGVVLGCFG